jgi:hypothetical protein
VNALVIPAVVLGTGVNAAQAGCEVVQHNVAGYDSGFNGFGNRGDIFVNDIQYSDLDCYVVRSLFVLGPGPADVEAGWVGGPGDGFGSVAPQAYLEIVTSNGSDSGFRPGGPPVQKGNYPNIKLTAPGDANTNGNYLWTAYRDGSSFDHATMGFHYGMLVTNSERKDPSDTMFAEFRHLDNCAGRSQGDCDWFGTYLHLQCYLVQSGGDYLFDKDSNQHHFVRQNSGNNC